MKALSRYILLVTLISGPVSLSFASQAPSIPVLPLDEEAIFCLYHKMSGESMDARDVEDLCFRTGRPIFTAFKPSEMFGKSRVREVTDRLARKMRAFGEKTVFQWNSRIALRPGDAGRGEAISTLLHIEMPRPTPFISSEISEHGRRFFERAVMGLGSLRLNSRKDTHIHVAVYFRPEKTDCRPERRFIAQGDVLLPLRYVILHPVKIRLFLPNSPDEGIVLDETQGRIDS